MALTTGSVASLSPGQYTGIIQTPVTTLTGTVAGGAVAAIPAANYGWIQVGGLFPALIVGTPAAGASLSCPTSVAGGVAINSGTLPIIGHMPIVGVDAKNKLIVLTLG